MRLDGLGNRPGEAQVSFGRTYRFYQETEALRKQAALARQQVDSEVELCASQGMLQVVSWLVHTDEETPDLTAYRRRLDRQA